MERMKCGRNLMNKMRMIKLAPGTTDYLAVNSPRVAKIMRGNRLASKKMEFRGGTGKLGKFWHLIWFMMRSILWRIPGKKTTGDIIEFAEPGMVTIHAEGEYQRLEGVRKIEIRKAERALKVVK